MSDDKNSLPDPAVFIDRLTDGLKANGDRLGAEGNVPGTGVSLWDLFKLRGQLQSFNKECIKTLAAGNDCTGDFNLSGGRKISLNVGFAQGADVVIEAESGAKRKVNIRPLPTAIGTPVASR